MGSEMMIPALPDELKTSSDYTVTVNGKAAKVFQTPAASICLFCMTGPVVLEVATSMPVRKLVVRPLRHGFAPEVKEGRFTLTLPEPMYLSVEVNDELRRPLFLFADAPEANTPDPSDPSVHYFEGGRVHEAGWIHLKDGEELYLEAGAVVRGRVMAENAENIRIAGRGILDGTVFEAKTGRMVTLTECRSVAVEGILILSCPSWTLVPLGSRNVHIRNLKIVGWSDCDDGIDVVGCRDVVIENCFVRTKDDCIAIKATAYQSDRGMQNVENVVVQRSVFWNAEWGNALEIGFETRAEKMRNIVFRDLDVIHAEREGHLSGGTFTIHNGDRALVENVVYEDIRVEGAEEKLIDIKVLHERYSKDEERGRIRNVVIKNVQVVDGDLPPSYVMGLDEDHQVENVLIEGLSYLGKPVRDAAAARMTVRHARNVGFA